MTPSFRLWDSRSITRLPPLGGVALCLVVTVLLLWPRGVRAELRETVTYRYYPVAVRGGESLASALRRETPVRPRWWQRFHGLATWNVGWTYRQAFDDAGQCVATEVTVDVATEITLPELVDAAPAQRPVFEAYLAALKVHELGHHAIATSAGQRVLDGIRGVGAWPDCQALDDQVRRLTDAEISDAKSAEQRYDSDTGFGRTQGARLEP